MQYVNSGVSLIHQGLGAYSASQFTTTSPHKTTSMSTPPVFPLLYSASLLLGFQLLSEASLSFTYSLVLIVQEKKINCTMNELESRPKILCHSPSST